MPMLEDGTVIPSFMGVMSTPRSEGKNAFDNSYLRYGEVVDIIYPDEQRSLGKKVIEYVVKVRHLDHDPAADDVGMKLFHALGALADQALEIFRGLGILEDDLKWLFHAPVKIPEPWK